MNSFPDSLTPRQRAKPSDFMLGPSDWRKNTNPGGRSGKFISKAERFPQPKSQLNECYSYSQNGTISHNTKNPRALNNPTAACFRAKTPQRPEPKRPNTDLYIKPQSDFGNTARAKSPATSCFRSTSDRFSVRKTEGNSSLRESSRKDQEVLQYSRPQPWVKASERGRGDATMRSKSDRFPKPKQLNEFYNNTPVVTAKGTSASVARADNRCSAWSKNSGHETFLPG